MKRALIGAVVLLATIGVVVVCATVLIRAPQTHVASSRSAPAPEHPSASAAASSTTKTDCSGAEHRPAGRYLGFASSSSVTATLSAFTRVTGSKPTITQLYVRFGTPFPTAEACRVASDGALPVIQINPRQVSLASIAHSERWTAYLKSYGEAIRAFGMPVAIGFAHEADGNWYQWGCAHTPPAQFVAAWRRLYNGVGGGDLRNAIWVWTVSSRLRGSPCSLESLWPGARYVTWIGLDGYLRNEHNSFQSIFGPALRDVRALSGKPVLITECGVNSGPAQAAQIGALLHAADVYPGVLGLIYFDAETNLSDYRPQDSPASLAAFRRAAAVYLKPGS